MLLQKHSQHARFKHFASALVARSHNRYVKARVPKAQITCLHPAPPASKRYMRDDLMTIVCATLGLPKALCVACRKRRGTMTITSIEGACGCFLECLKMCRSAAKDFPDTVSAHTYKKEGGRNGRWADERFSRVHDHAAEDISPGKSGGY